MPEIRVTDKTTGEERYIPSERYNADQHTLATDQVATVDPFEAGGEYAAGIEITEQTLQEAAPLQEVTSEARAALTREQVDDAVYDTTANTIEQGLRGVAAGALLGISERILQSDDPFERERQRRKRGQASTAFDVGQVIGSVAPSVLSGGTGAVGTLARLTPAGRLGAATTKLAARGGLKGTVKGSVYEGFAGAVGDSVARRTIAEDPDFSASTIISDGIKGAALGGVLGVVGHGLAVGAGKAGKALRESVDETVDAAAKRAAKKAVPLEAPTDTPAGFFGKKPPKKPTGYNRIVRKRLADESADEARRLGVQIDEMSLRTPGKELDDLVLSDGFRSARSGATDALEARARQLSTQLADDTAEAKKWFGRYADDVDLTNAKKRLVKDVSDEVEDHGIVALGALDRTSYELDRTLDELAAVAGLTRQTRLAVPTDAAGDALNKTLKERALGTAGRARETGEAVLGAAETAQSLGVDTGLPSARDIPLIGGLASLYLQAKTGIRLAKGRGLIPSSRITQAASQTISASEKIAQSVKLAASGALLKASRAPRLLRLTPTQVAVQAVSAATLSPQETSDRVLQQTRELGDEVALAAAQTAGRAQEYLAANAPTDPVPMRLGGMGKWEPSTQQSLDWQRRTTALADPIGALADALIDPMSSIELDAVRTVYPPLWQAFRSELQMNLPKLTETYPQGQLRAIGRAFDIVTTIDLIPGYGVSPDGIMDTAPTEMNARFAAPTVARNSPAVKSEQTADERRAR